jgi:8-oxo-dGTP diphosphatase
MTAAKRIGIAIVEHNRHYLVGIRGPDVPLAGYAEFPGGKCLADETAVNCAVRECREESGLNVIAVRLLDQREFDYPHGRVDLSFILCQPANLLDVRDHHLQFRWVSVGDLPSLKFPEANEAVVNLLIKLAQSEGSTPCSA